jgi:cell division protein FtsI/penicillin-binding protein 2
LGDTLTSFDPVARRRVLSPETAREMTEMLVEVVSLKGTARRARIDQYEVAGKTGTSQKIIEGRYSNQAHIASFTGFFPAKRPRIVMTVVVDEPNGDSIGYGGLVAAPIFQQVGEELIQYFGIEPVGEEPSMVAWKGGPLESAP